MVERTADEPREVDERGGPGQAEATGAAEPWAVDPTDPGGLRYLRLGAGRWTGTPRAAGPAAGLRYATFAARAMAFAIDVAVVSVAFALVDVLGQAIEVGVGVGQGLDGLVALNVIQDAALLVVVLGGFGWAWSVLGCSPGQLVAGLRTLRRADGGRVPGLAAVGRAVLLLGPWLVLARGPALTQMLLGPAVGASGPSPDALWSLVALAVVIWYVLLAWSSLEDPRGQGWHDTVAGSVVVGAHE